MSFTKATLTTAIQDYTDNSETTFVNNIPNFVKAAEEKMQKINEAYDKLSKAVA